LYCIALAEPEMAVTPDSPVLARHPP
jgi:hypothetical protein